MADVKFICSTSAQSKTSTVYQEGEIFILRVRGKTAADSVEQRFTNVQQAVNRLCQELKQDCVYEK